MRAVWLSLILVLILTLEVLPRVSRADSNAPEFLTAREPAKGATAFPPSHWSPTENVVWKLDLAPLGWSSPVVWGKRIFLTTCVTTGGLRAPKKGLYLEELDANKYPREAHDHLYKVYCIDLISGN